MHGFCGFCAERVYLNTKENRVEKKNMIFVFVLFSAQSRICLCVNMSIINEASIWISYFNCDFTYIHIYNTLGAWTANACVVWRVCTMVFVKMHTLRFDIWKFRQKKQWLLIVYSRWFSITFQCLAFALFLDSARISWNSIVFFLVCSWLYLPLIWVKGA